MEDLIYWIGILLLIFGVYQGYIYVINQRKEKVIFNYSYASISPGHRADGTFLLLFSGIITNAGNKPLIPSLFIAEMTYKKETLLLQRELVPPDGRFKGHITISNGQADDLQLLKNVAITSSSPISGHLMFSCTKEIDSKTFPTEEAKIKLTCVDVYQKKYISRFSITNNFAGPGSIPKYNINIDPKD